MQAESPKRHVGRLGRVRRDPCSRWAWSADRERAISQSGLVGLASRRLPPPSKAVCRRHRWTSTASRSRRGSLLARRAYGVRGCRWLRDRRAPTANAPKTDRPAQATTARTMSTRPSSSAAIDVGGGVPGRWRHKPHEVTDRHGSGDDPRASRPANLGSPMTPAQLPATSSPDANSTTGSPDRAPVTLRRIACAAFPGKSRLLNGVYLVLLDFERSRIVSFPEAFPARLFAHAPLAARNWNQREERRCVTSSGEAQA